MGGGANRGKSLHRFVLWVFSLFRLCLPRSVQPARATHSHMTLISVFRICREGIAAATARQFPKSTQQGKHLACNAPKSETSPSLNTSLLATRNLSFESSCSITHQESPVLGRHPRHPPAPRTVMWFFGAGAEAAVSRFILMHKLYFGTIKQFLLSSQTSAVALTPLPRKATADH